MAYNAADGLFTVFGKVMLKRVFLMVGHATSRIFYTKVALSFDLSTSVDVLSYAGSFKSNGTV